ncbi:hypothetical protein ANO11243_055100 [Dothideomycetidae sp. 11243]|nr:hypothetical protein ANO11243_055100 [fungal sp. No.11243]
MAIKNMKKDKRHASESLSDTERALLSSPSKPTDITRASFQTLMRDKEDWGKVPQFALLVLLCGEYLPLLVPFMPGLVPRTCRIPKQIEGMRKTRETRKRHSQEVGYSALSRETIDAAMVAEELRTDAESAHSFIDKHTPARTLLVDAVVDRLSGDQLLHASTLLNCHGRLWGRIGLTPPQSLLIRRVKRRLQYLAIDDTLLLWQGQGSVKALTDEEVRIACDERAIEVSGQSVKELQTALVQWLGRLESANVLAYFEYIFGQSGSKETRSSEKKALEGQ